MITAPASRSLARILVRGTGVLAAAVLLVAVGLYAASEWMIRRTYDAPLEAVPSVSAASDLEEGRRLAIIVGCWAGCHGMEGEGDTLNVPGIYRVTGPTLSSVLPRYSDQELVRLVRYGIKRDGRTAIGMASGTFFPLSNLDLARIIAHLRRAPSLPPVPRERHVTWLGRVGLLMNKWETSAGEVDRAMPRWGELPRTTPFERGRYLASITCSECHGFDLRGEAFEGSPSLAVVAGYRVDQFRRLMRTGVPQSGRDLGIMSWTARNAFTYFTDQEIDDLYSYLRTYAGGGAPVP
jgi:mono/diheme cytochrome c family protein